MDMFIFTIYDRVSGVYSEPFLAVNQGVAVRRFNFLMQNSAMVKDDCQLYCIGVFNTLSGVVDSSSNPEFICSYSEVSSDE